MAFFAEDATITASAPFQAGRYTDRAGIRSFVTDHLAREIRVDLTRKQVAHNGVTWTVRTPTGDGPANRAKGTVEAEFQGGEITSLRLGSATGPGKENVGVNGGT